MHVTAPIPSRLRGQRGLSLIEVLVALLIGASLAATIGWFQHTQFLTLEDQAAQLDVQTAARAVIDVFARDVRRAGMDPRCTKAVQALLEASPTTVRIQADLNANGALDVASEDLRYRIVGDTRLERRQGNTVEPLLDGVDLAGSRFRYYDASGAEIVTTGALTTAQRAQVRRVRLELAVHAPAHSTVRGADLVAEAATDVELRNRFFVAVTGCS